MNLENLSFSIIIAGLIFSSVGWILFKHGRKEAENKIVVIGLALMLYPYFIESTKLMWLIGLALSAWGYWEAKGKYG